MIFANRYIFLSKEVLVFNYPINTVINPRSHREVT